MSGGSRWPFSLLLGSDRPRPLVATVRLTRNHKPSHHEMASSDSESKAGWETPRNESETAVDLPRRTWREATASHLKEEIRPTMFAEIQLLLLTFCTGIQG